MSGHTKGPWRLARSGLTVVAGEPDPNAGYPNGRPVADTVYGAVPLPERQANAALIASAPALLAACEDALDFADRVGLDDEYPGQQRQAIETAATLRAAVAQARGEAVT